MGVQDPLHTRVQEGVTGLPEDVNDRFDALGKMGWELVRTEPLLERAFFGQGSYTRGLVAFFKKPLAD